MGREGGEREEEEEGMMAPLEPVANCNQSRNAAGAPANRQYVENVGTDKLAGCFGEPWGGVCVQRTARILVRASIAGLF